MDRFNREHFIPTETVETLKIKEPEATKCHMLSKMHKIDSSGRPTVSFIGFLGTNILKFVNYRLQPVLKIYLLTCKIQVTF